MKISRRSAYRRKRESFDVLLDWFVRAPWWTPWVSATVLYALVAYGIPAALHTSLVVWSAIAFLWASLVLMVGGASFVARREQRLLLITGHSVADLRSLDWREFEQLVKAAFERDGYRVAATGHDRADGGVDLVLRRKGRQIYVQCKRWKQNQLVGVEQVRALHGVAAAEGADSSVFVISGIFSEPARQFARKVGMRLIDGDELVRFVSELDTSQPPENATGPSAGDANGNSSDASKMAGSKDVGPLG